MIYRLLLVVFQLSVGGLLLIGTSTFASIDVVPPHMVETLKENVQWIAERVTSECERISSGGRVVLHVQSDGPSSRHDAPFHSLYKLGIVPSGGHGSAGGRMRHTPLGVPRCAGGD